MSTSKRIDVICIVVTCVTLIITLLFMNGKALGIKEIVKEVSSEESGIFTDSDLYDDPTTTKATLIELSGSSAKVTGNGAYYANGSLYIAYAGTYVLSGQLDGNIIVKADGDDKIWLIFDGVSINSQTDAGLRIEQADKVFLNLKEGSDNTISCGNTYSSELINKGVDGAIFSRDDLTINGKGSLKVTAGYKHGIVCNDTLKITDGNITVSAKEDGIHVNDNLMIRDAEITISAGDDGITVSNDENQGDFYIESGRITVLEAYEGIEAVNITIKGGDITINCSDDGFNARGTGTDKGIFIYDGSIKILNNTGRDADGIDSNGSIYIYGGDILVSIDQSTGYALDAGTESGGSAIISGGTIVACGGSGMAEKFSESSSQASFSYGLSTATSENTTLVLTDSSGSQILNKTIPYSFTSAVISCSDLEKGGNYKLIIADTSYDVELTNMSTSIGNAGGMNMGGGMKGQFQKGQQATSMGQLQENLDATSGASQMPEGTQMPSEEQGPGMSQMPSEEQNHDMGQMPEGMQVPSRGQKPDRSQMQGEAQSFDKGQMMGEGTNVDMNQKSDETQNMKDNSTGKTDRFNMNQNTNELKKYDISYYLPTIVLIGISFLLLVTGLVFVIKYKEKF